MYNFKEIKNLNELKELCFYIKAINETHVDTDKYENMGQVKDYLKNEYNLEISISKLYLFVQKIKTVYNKDKFPEEKIVDDLLKQYIVYIRKQQSNVEKELEKAELNIKDPKHKAGKNKFVSSEQLSNDIALKRKMYTKESNSLLVWAGVFSVFIVSIIYCIIGIGFPKVLSLYITKAQEVVLVLLSICILTYLIYWLLYLINYKEMDELKFVIENYYKYEELIKNDVAQLNTAKQNLYAFKNQFSINGIEMTDDAIYDFLKNSDEIDVKYYNSKINSKSLGKELNLRSNKSAQFTQVISKHEQDKQWKESEFATLEKQNMNKELIVRVDALAESLNKKGVSSDVMIKISELYCNELSVEERRKQIDEANSKIELTKNYCKLIEKIQTFEKLEDIDTVKGQPALKSKLQVSIEERVAFSDSLSQMFNRIEKANSLGLLTSGQAQTYKNIQKELSSGIIQGVQIDAVVYRYDLAKLYIRLYDELSTYDILN